MNITYRWCLPVLLLFVMGNLPGQSVNNFVKNTVMPAPNAAALGKYGDIPVSYYTGVPNVSLPIYTLEEGPLSLPISLSYHSSGVRVAELASWVGIGWSLNAGGMITRTIQGTADDDTANKGYYSDALKLDFNSAMQVATIAAGKRDSEPDVFSYNIGGVNGKFYIDKNRVIQLVPQQDIKVKLVLDGSRFGGFVVTGTDGVRYYFGTAPESTAKALESSMIFADGNANTTSWYLVRIESPDGNYQINLSYVSETYSYKTPAPCAKQYVECESALSSDVTCANSPVNSQGIPYTRVDVTGQRLSKITAGNTTASFIATVLREDTEPHATKSGGAYRLENIDISAGSGSYCSRHTLSYSYFSGGTSKLSSRLKLTQVKESSCDGTISNPPTKFTYNGPVTNGVQSLPDRLSRAVDHWGFYNGASNSNMVNIPSSTGKTSRGSTVTYPTSSSNRETNETYMLYGSLSKIEYPTGGSTAFTLEANTSLQQVLGPASFIVNIPGSGNGPMDPASCNKYTKYATYTFTTDEQITNAVFTLAGQLPANNACPYPDQRIVRVAVTVDATGAAVGLPISINLNQTGYIAPVIQPIKTIGNFVKGVKYRFTLTTDKAFGQFNVTTKSASLSNVKVGGLRIKQIVTNDGISSSKNIVKTYDYALGGGNTNSSGQLYQKPVYMYSHYGPVATWTYDFTLANNSAASILIFSDQPYIPLTSFEGYHIGYTKVKETVGSGNGYTEYTFHSYTGAIGDQSYPRGPQQVDVRAGQQKQIAHYKEGGTALLTTTLDPAISPAVANSGQILRTSQPYGCGNGGNQNSSQGAFYNTYTIQSASFLVGTKTEVANGVSTVTTYTYDKNRPYLAPTSESVTNSDGKVTKTSYLYAYDLTTNTNLKTYLLDRNMIGEPLETKVEVSGRLVGGSKTEYTLFDHTTGATASSGTLDPKPYKFYAYEMTWNGSTATTAAAVLKGVVNSYHGSASEGRGYPKQYTATNWPAETYDWKNGLIIKRTYKDYVWKYGYVSGTRLLSSITDIDLQTTSYTYDKLQRLKTISARNAAVVTTYDYHYTASTVSADKNYVKSSTTYTAVTGSNLTNQTSWQYLDGLGRPIQTVQQKAGPNSIGIATTIQYDNQGRTVRISNPFATADITGAFVAEPANTKYTLTGYEASPLSRVTSVTPPDWYATTTTYGSNSSNDAVFKDNETDKYGSNLLYKTTVKDPAGNAIITFTDKKGRVVLTRRASSTTATSGADTYSRYDDKDRVTMVTPPGTTASTGNVIFRYTYDKANNLLSKKVPDADAVTYKYNTRDQPVLMQDGNLAAGSKWIASVYDDYGRVTATGNWSGTVPSPISPTDLTIKAADELTKAYYDGYDGSSQTSLTTYPQYRGKVRKSLAKVLDGSSTATWLYTTNSYDAHGRLTGTTGNNYQNASDASSEVMTMTYDWADNLLRQTRVHKPSSSVVRTLAYRNTYGASGQRAGLYLKVDSGSEQLLANYTYNERDLLAQRNLHGIEVNGDDGHLQSLDYSYNAQGWLTRINQPGLTTSTGVGLKVSPTAPVAPNPATVAFSEDGPDGNDLFYLELRYDQLLSGLTGTVRKDGNIAQVIWRTRGRERQAYSATYDYLSRMSTASYYDITDGGTVSSDQKYKEEVTYADARGNIATLKRNGMYPDGAAWKVGQIDNLTYTSTSGTNRLASVSDAASVAVAKPFGFNPGAGGTGYTYDVNGNLTKDTYKGITAITYNYLNLPSRISFGSSKSITFTYDATGRKLKKVTAGGAGAENYTQYYADGLEYRSTTLEAIYHEEGRLTPKSGGGWQYEYSIRDHLGNTRVTFADKDGDNTISVTNSASTNEVLQENHYTPFGLELGYAWMNDAALADSKYTFGGKELNADFGLKLNDHGARWYDPSIARWTSVDPLTNDMPSWSPYNFTYNNPILFNDPDGKEPQVCPTCPTAAAGAVIGGLIGGGLSLMNQISEGGSIDWGQVGIDALQGGATGGAIGLLGPLALPASVEVGTTAGVMITGSVAGTASGVSELASQGLEIATDRRESLDGGKIATDMMVGGVAGGGGALVGTSVRTTLSSTASNYTVRQTATQVAAEETARAQAPVIGAGVGTVATNFFKNLIYGTSSTVMENDQNDEQQ